MNISILLILCYCCFFKSSDSFISIRKVSHPISRCRNSITPIHAVPVSLALTAKHSPIVTKFLSTFCKTAKYLLSPAISGGLLAGGLHAVTGPDHLAAIFPPSIGKSYLVGMQMGASWGLGHGLSATLLGVGGFLLKGRFSSSLAAFPHMSKITESAVGVSLLLIGMLGIKENITPDDHHTDAEMNTSISKGKGIRSIRALFANGFIHGFSWDGAPSLAPALAMSSWPSAMSFLLAYCLGTTLIMSATAGAVGESTLRLGKVVQSKDLTRNLSISSSIIAILVGIYWLYTVIFG